MKKNEYIIISFLSATGVFLYVSTVAWLMSHGEKFLGNRPDNFLMPVTMLLLFIVSASVTSLMVLGKPIHLYFNGLKKEAIYLLLATLGWLVLFIIAVTIALILKLI
jgi:hypothetical protein